MASTTGATVVTGAFGLLGLLSVEAGEVPTAAQMADGLRRLNLMIGRWSISPLSVPYVGRETFSLTAGKATYTMGPGGDFNTTRPQRLSGAGLLLAGTSPTVELPRALLTDDAYQAIQIKDLTNPLFTAVYYNPTYASGYGSVTLWPVPNTADNSIALYRLEQLPLFTSSTASYDIPEGADEAMEYQLALRLGPVYTVPVSPDVRQMATAAYGAFKRANLPLSDLPQDPAFVSDPRTGYNIVTGTGGSGGS